MGTESIATRKAEGVTIIPKVELALGLREAGPPPSFFKRPGMMQRLREDASYGARPRSSSPVRPSLNSASPALAHPASHHPSGCRSTFRMVACSCVHYNMAYATNI